MQPLLHQARSCVVDAIVSGEFAIGSTLPACAVLSERAGCSPGTVQRALAELANEGLIDRVRNRGTVVVRKPVTKRVCLLLAQDAHLNLLLQQAVFETLSALGFHVEVVPITVDPAGSAAHLRTLRSGSFPVEHLITIEPAGSVIFHRDLADACAQFPQRVDFSLESFSMPGSRLVSVDHLNASGQVVRHLLGLGHRRIAVLAGDQPGEDGFAAVSAQACGELLTTAGAQCFPHYMAQDWLDGLCKRMVDERITACWALNDMHAMNLIGLCPRYGLRVPEDVSIVGRFDTPWSVQCRPQLTSVALDAPAIARAIGAALSAISAARPLNRPPVMIATTLIARGSTGPAPTATSSR